MALKLVCWDASPLCMGRTPGNPTSPPPSTTQHAQRALTKMRSLTTLGLVLLTGIASCSNSDSADHSVQADAAVETGTETAQEGGWSVGDTIPSGMPNIPDIEVLEVHANGSGEVCGNGRSATLKYKAMKADGAVLDPGTRPFTFVVGGGGAIKGWDVIVARMRVGDSFTIALPQDLAYGPAQGDLKFDMELLSFN